MYIYCVCLVVLCVYFVFECIVHACVVLPGLTCVCVYGVRVLVVLCVLCPVCFYVYIHCVVLLLCCCVAFVLCLVVYYVGVGVGLCLVRVYLVFMCCSVNCVVYSCSVCIFSACVSVCVCVCLKKV